MRERKKLQKNYYKKKRRNKTTKGNIDITIEEDGGYMIKTLTFKHVLLQCLPSEVVPLQDELLQVGQVREGIIDYTGNLTVPAEEKNDLGMKGKE